MTRERILLGRRGEEIAATYLEGKDYLIIKQNYRTRFGEIDLIATKDSTLIFVEVRTKATKNFGKAEESITSRKRLKVRRVAEQFIQEKRINYKDIRFDVIALCLRDEAEPELTHYINAF